MTDKQIEEKALEAYPESFAWSRCDENSETYTEIDGDGIKWLKVDRNKTYREGYIKAIKDIKSLPKTIGWIAKEKDGTISFFNKKPQRFIDENNNCTGWYSENGCETAINFDSDIPELTWESEPLEVELIIRKL